MILLLLSACTDYGFKSALDVSGVAPQPAISVEPDQLNFWSVGSGESEVLTFTVRNVGDALLQVDDLTLEGSGSFALVDGALSFELAPGELRDIDVIFVPIEPAAQEATALVWSDDPERPQVPVALLGEGRVPYLQITPNPYDFGALPVACGDAVELTLQNVGTEGLTLTELAYEGDGQLTLRDHDVLPLTLPVNAWTTVWVDFLPAVEGDTEGRMVVTSNDPRGALAATQLGQGAPGSMVIDTFTVEENPPVDVLFAVDRSCSMDDDAASLAENFSAFIDAVGEVTEGWQIGVVTQDDGCFNGGVLTASTPALDIRFSQAVSTGDDADISDDEALFQLIDRALEASDGGCNAGFLRAGAPLHAVVISDEPERSEEQAAAWTWEFWLERLLERVDGDRLLVSGVVDVDGCNEGDANYAEVIDATGGERLSICSGDWAEHVATLAAATTSALFTFALSETPAGELSVEVDGELVEDGWRYEPHTNSVIFEVLSEGAAVRVSYGVEGTCP